MVLSVQFYRIAEHWICAHILCGIYTLCVYTAKRVVQQTCLAVGVEGSELCNGPLVSLGAPSPLAFEIWPSRARCAFSS